MSISTRGIGNVDISTTTSKVKSKAEEKAADAFASLMDIAAPKDYDTNVITDKTDDVSSVSGMDDVSDIENVSKSDVTSKYDNSTNEYSSEKTDSVENDEEKDLIKTSEVESKSTDADIDEELVAESSDILLELVDMITKELDISVEELENVLNDMNLSLEDLLDVSNLRDFILNCEDCTNVDLLINEELSEMVNDVCGNLEEILVEHDITDVDELINFIKNNSNEIYQTMESDNAVSLNSIETNIEDLNQDDVHITKTDESNNINISDLSEENIDSEMDVEKSGENANYNPEGNKNTSENAQNTIINNLNQAVNDAFSANGMDGIVSYTNGIQEADIVRQIIDEIKVNLTKETTSMEVQLNPESLGKVQINVSSKDGVISAQIIAENEAAKHAIENSISVLKEAFNNQELKVEAVEVMIASYEFFNKEQNNDFNENDKSDTTKNGSVINLNDSFEEENISEAEQLQIEIMRQNGNSVSYSI